MTFTPPATASADIGVTGLGVMGSNLARNLARNGHRVAVHNRSATRTERLVTEHGDEGTFVPTDSLDDFVRCLERPRVAIIMVQAGRATDEVLQELASRMEPGDIIVDCGNALFSDTRRREAALRDRGLHFVGCGVSGGEEGALLGPAIMPGGSKESYERIGPMLERISAKVEGDPCCTHVGADGAGHFVKMIHNGIEYADMQLIGESYQLLRSGLGLDPAAIAEVFDQWRAGELDSYLMEVSVHVLRHRDARTGLPLVDVIADAAGQKGTGVWTSQVTLDLGVPATAIAEATFARALSSSTPQRAAAKQFEAAAPPWQVTDPEAFIEDVRQALHASKLIAYSQGLNVIQAAGKEYGWELDLAAIARIWRGGCIIRARFLDEVARAYTANPDLPLLVADEFFSTRVIGALPAWRRVVSEAARHGTSIPVHASSLAYHDGLRADRLPAALIQGQRDFFGAHTYQRIDEKGSFHILWNEPDRKEVKA